MSLLSTLLVLLLPTMVGAPLLGLLDRAGQRGAVVWLGRIGAGWLLGVPLCGAILRLFHGVEPMGLFSASIIWLLLLSAALWAAFILRERRNAGPVEAPSVPLGGWNALCWLLLILLAAHWLLAAMQALWLPTLTWDAWTTWLGKPKAWSGATELQGFQTLKAWADNLGEGAPAVLAPHYPESIPRYLLLLVSAHGQWSNPVSDLPWLLLTPMLALALFAGCRRSGFTSPFSMIMAYALLSMPLVDAHIALAGYLDLWLAALLALAAISLLRWRIAGDRRQLLQGVLFAISLPLVKQEGAVWLLVLLASALLLALPPRLRWLLVGAGVVIPLIGLLVGGLPIPAPGLGTVWLRWGEITVPGIGEIELALHPVAPEVFASLFLLPNFHLLWWLLPVGALLGWRQQRFDRAAKGLGLLLLLGLGFVGFLFFFTDAAAWAKNLTSLNRIVLQLAPVAILFLGALFRSGFSATAGLPSADPEPTDPEPADTAMPTAR